MEKNYKPKHLDRMQEEASARKNRLPLVLVRNEMYDDVEVPSFFDQEDVEDLYVQNYISTGKIKVGGDIFIAVNRDKDREKHPENGITADYSCDATAVIAGGDIEIYGNAYVGYEDGDCSGVVQSGGLIAVEELNAGAVYAPEHFVARTTNLDVLICGGDVEADYLYCQCGAFVLGDINVKYLVCETSHVFCGGKFTGEFRGDRLTMLHEGFTDWKNIKKYL